MPNVTLYIRQADLEKWNALPNKAQAVSDMLQGTKVRIIKGWTADKSKDKIKIPAVDLTEPFGSNCLHPNVNKRTGICLDCGEYTR